eukprot:gnl/TRDRNA2_/TRDRNA2_141754_c0_seq1.p1 gnl/TRDRNA2_/TRDRNA2_141754_c0~~gnl/TRDRNA2_/TRDRNA2_141754_c0_seq1.p1  ORF type:complete len:458 (-),score=47.03 gnl/TRDRNA2_/TRDRNA2_141754_c0_seq1:88-1461(-)
MADKLAAGVVITDQDNDLLWNCLRHQQAASSLIVSNTTVSIHSRSEEEPFGLAAPVPPKEIALKRQSEHDVTADGRMYQGDILVEETPKEIAPPVVQYAATSRWTGTLLEIQNVVAEGRRWAGNVWSGGRVPYCFADGVSDAVKEAMQAAVDHIKLQVPCLIFTEIKAVDSERCDSLPSILVKGNTNGCWSCLGQVSNVSRSLVGKSQPLNLDVGCDTMPVAVHEIAHALGLLHEMSRVDRGKYLTLHKENVDPGIWERNFQLNVDAYKDSPYDYFSLMHYDAYAFSSNGRPTIVAKDRPVSQFIGQRMGLSELDVHHIGEMYGCNDTVKPFVENAHLLRVISDQAGSYKGECGDLASTGYLVNGKEYSCQELAIWCKHETHGDMIKSMCPYSCFMCGYADVVPASRTTTTDTTTSNTTSTTTTTREMKNSAPSSGHLQKEAFLACTLLFIVRAVAL